jgi:hypothetical protein
MNALSRARSTARRATTSWSKRFLVHLAWFIAAALFVAALLLTYGLDLSPGFF